MQAVIDWIMSNGVAVLAILTAVGTLAGVVEKFTTGKVSNVAAVIAGALIDLVKVITNIYAAFGGQPPTSSTGKRLMRGVFDNTATAPTVSLRGFVPWIGVALASFFVFAFAMMVSCAANIPLTVTATANEVECITAAVDAAPSPTFEQLASSCAVPTIALVVQIVADILTAEKAPMADAGTTFVLPSEFHKHLLAVHHATGAN
jgi:hypothetical protein